MHSDIRIKYLVLKNRYENINVDVKFKPPWFVELNPLGKVPTIQVKTKKDF